MVNSIVKFPVCMEGMQHCLQINVHFQLPHLQPNIVGITSIILMIMLLCCR